MALSYVSQIVQPRASGDSLQQTTGLVVAAGDLVVVASSTFFSNGDGTTVVTDDAGQTYSQAVVASVDAVSKAFIHYKENHPGGTIKVTVNPNGTSADIDFTVSRVSGALTASALDKTATNTDTGTAASVASGVLAQADEILFAIVTHGQADVALTEDAAGGYTLIGENENNTTGQTYNAQYKIVASTASDTADWALGAVKTWFTALATFKAAAGGGAAVTYPQLERMARGIERGILMGTDR